MTSQNETKQAVDGNWDNDFANKENKSESSDSKKLPFMKFPETGQYRIRLVGGHVKYYKHWRPINAITHPDYKDEDPAWKAGFYPSRRYAIHIIDRADGQLKILDKGSKIFEAFAAYKTVNDINPAGKEAPDFMVLVKIPIKDGKPNIKASEYQVQPMAKIATLTQEEIDLYKNDKISLQDRYRSYTIDKIKELWAAVPENERVPPKKDKDKEKVTTSSTATSAPAKVEDTDVDEPNNDNDNPFTDESTDANAEGSGTEKDPADLF